MQDVLHEVFLKREFCSNFFFLDWFSFIQADAKTLKFKDKVLKKGGTWRDIYGIDEKKIASLVRQDKVDILVELTGHTANNKLGTMACRPAPVQVHKQIHFLLVLFVLFKRFG